MGDHGSDPSDESVDERLTDLDDEAAEEKVYECNDCGYRMEAEHQPGECPQCGGDMIDISLSRE